MNKEKSAGLAFLQAAAAAMPRTLGDRERIFAMCRLMTEAVHNRFAFDKDDGPALYRMGLRTCVGVFRPLDYYYEACCAGGTYARMWEHYHQLKPWVASQAIVNERDYRGCLERAVVVNNRVAEHLGVLMPREFADNEDGLAIYEDAQVWWCTSMDHESITLCRYRMPAQPEYGAAFMRYGSPAQRRKLDRDEWALWNPKLVKKEKMAA